MMFIGNNFMLFMKVNIFLLTIFLLSGVVCAEGYSVNFSVAGCTFMFGGNIVGVSSGECSSGGEEDGLFYCDEDGTRYITTEDGVGCSLGLNQYIPGEAFCCPSDSFCNETSSGVFKCDVRSENCFNQTTVDECKENGCIWMDDTCVANPREYDCSYYDTEDECLLDSWHLGISGIGTELCGTTIECEGEIFSVPEANCSCEWNSEAVGDKCQPKLVAVQMFYDTEPDTFECSNVYTLGECIGGVQSVEWFSTSQIVGGFDSGIPNECLVALGCNNGVSERFCGEPIIKLPAFSLFSLFVSLSIFVAYYLLLGKFKYRKAYDCL